LSSSIRGDRYTSFTIRSQNPCFEFKEFSHQKAEDVYSALSKRILYKKKSIELYPFSRNWSDFVQLAVTWQM